MTIGSNFSGKMCDGTTCALSVVSFGEMCGVVNDSLVINLCAQLKMSLIVIGI